MSKPGLTKSLRFAAAIVAGMIVMTMIAETVEFATVALLNGGITTDPSAYLAIRNQTSFLLFKLFYNAIAGFAGGLLAARVYGHEGVWSGACLALLQSACLVWAMLNPDIGPMAPRWLWIALVLVMSPSIVLGSKIGRTGRFPEAAPDQEMSAA